MQKDPKSAMQKYGHNARFKEFLVEFNSIMGGHFEQVADKEKKAAEEKQQQEEERRRKEEEAAKSDPVY